MCEHIEDIIGLFHKEKAIRYKLEEIRLEEDDSRWVLFVVFILSYFSSIYKTYRLQGFFRVLYQKQSVSSVSEDYY